MLHYAEAIFLFFFHSQIYIWMLFSSVFTFVVSDFKRLLRSLIIYLKKRTSTKLFKSDPVEPWCIPLSSPSLTC